MATIAMTITSDAYENGIDQPSELSGESLRAWLRENMGVDFGRLVSFLKQQGYQVSATVDGTDWYA